MDPDDSQQAMEVLREAESMRPVGVVNIEPIPEGEDAISTQIGTITVQPVLPVVEPNTKAADKTEEAVVENHSGDNQSRTLGTFKPIGTVIADTDNGSAVPNGDQDSHEITKPENSGGSESGPDAGGDAPKSGSRYRAGGSTALTPSAGAPPPSTTTTAQKPKAAPSETTCNVCGRILSSVEACKSHIANHSKDDFVMLKCGVCGWAFESQMQMKMHKKKHGSSAATKPQEGAATETPKGPSPDTAAPAKPTAGDEGGSQLTSLACLFCGRALNSREALKDHQNNHCNNFNFYQCPSCDQCFETIPPLAKHRKAAHKFHGSSDNVPRLYEGDEDIDFNCGVCERVFKTEGKLEEHTSNHKKGVTMFKCNICGWDFEGKGDLHIHKRNKHKDTSLPAPTTPSPEKKGNKLPCTECGRPFKTTHSMHAHLENHHNGTKLYACKDCGFAYENSGTMYYHRSQKHSVPKKDDPTVMARTCLICKRVLPDEVSKEAHTINHTNDVPMTKCSTCGWEFEVEEAYYEHIETDHKKKTGPGGQHACQNCGRKFNSETALDTHIQNHMDGETMYKCDLCPFEFETAEQCAKHVKKCGKTATSGSAKKEKIPSERGWKYQCDLCDRKFQSETVLAVHLQNHLNGTELTKCDHCRAQFEKEAEREWHMRTHKSKDATPKKRKEEQQTVCSQCDRQFYYESAMMKHRENHFNGTELFKCKHCPWEYEKEVSLKTHVNQYHPFYGDVSEFATPKAGRRSGAGKFPCVMCKRNLTSMLNYAQHLVHHEKMPYTCPYDKCGWVFEDHKHFQAHREKMHEETSDGLKYRLEKAADEQAKGDEISKEDERLLEMASPEKSVSFALVCPRCRETFENRKKLETHASRCKVDYDCKLCELQFKSLYEFEYHIYPENMECEVCKKMFGSECVLQSHLMKVHFSADMIDEQQKQQEQLSEAQKKAEEEKAAAKGKRGPKPKTEPTATVVRESSPEPESPAAKIKESPKAKPKPGPKSSKAKKAPRSPRRKSTDAATPTRTLTPRRAKTAPANIEPKEEAEEKDGAASDEHLVSSTVDTPPDGASVTSQKRKRTTSGGSNTIDSSDDPSDAKRKKANAEDGDSGFVCDVNYCGGTFFSDAQYMKHVRHVHEEISTVTSDERRSVIMLKDAKRTRPTQRGPASKRKEFTLLRVQCLQGSCGESGDRFFTTTALYNQHAADEHAGKEEAASRSAKKKSTRASVKNDDTLVQSTVLDGDDAEEPDTKKRKTDGGKTNDIEGMISKASLRTLHKDLEDLGIDAKKGKKKKKN